MKAAFIGTVAVTLLTVTFGSALTTDAIAATLDAITTTTDANRDLYARRVTNMSPSRMACGAHGTDTIWPVDPPVGAAAIQP